MLSLRKSRFAAEYVIDLSAKKAAIRAGYSSKTASSQGSRLLRDVNVASEIARRQKANSEKLDVSEAKILCELTRIAFADIRHFAELPIGSDLFLEHFLRIPQEHSAALKDIAITEYKCPKTGRLKRRRVSIKLADKVRALELLGRHIGMFKATTQQENTEDLIQEILDEIDQFERARRENLVRAQAQASK